VGRGLVGLANNGQVGEVSTETHDQLIFIAFTVSHLLIELCSNSQGLRNNIKLELFHFYLPPFFLS